MARRIGIRVVAWAMAVAALLGNLRRADADESPPPAPQPVPQLPEPLTLTVERSPGAEDCPDDSKLTSTLGTLRGQAGLGHTRYRVLFLREPDGFRVIIRSDPSGRERTLASREPTCTALGHATAVTLAVLFDSELDSESEPAAPPPESTEGRANRTSRPPSPAPAARDARDVDASHPRRRRTRIDPLLAAGATGWTGVLGPTAFGLTGEAGIMTGRFRASLGALFLPRRTLSLGPGEVREDLVAGLVRVCLAPARTERYRLDACTGVLGGVLGAEATGYTRNEQRNRPWLAIPLEAVGTVWTGRLGWEFGLGAAFPLHRDDFGIDGLGVAYRSPSVSGVASLRVVVAGWPW